MMTGLGHFTGLTPLATCCLTWGNQARRLNFHAGLTLHQVSQSYKISNKNTDKFCMFLSKTHCICEGRCLRFHHLAGKWWHRPVMSALGRLWQEDTKFQASLGYIVRHCCKTQKTKPKRLYHLMTSQPPQFLQEDSMMFIHWMTK